MAQSPNQEAHYVRTSLIRWFLIGLLPSMVLAYVMSSLLHQLHSVVGPAKASLNNWTHNPHLLILSIGPYGAISLVLLAILLMGAGVGWLVTHIYQKQSDTESLSITLAGIGVGFVLALVFASHQIIVTQAESAPELVSWTPYGSTFSAAKHHAVPEQVLFWIVLLTGLGCAALMGVKAGQQEYGLARRQGASRSSTRAPQIHSPASIDVGLWGVGIISFLMPIVGYLLYQSYSNRGDDKASAAAIGSLAGVVGAILFAVSRFMLATRPS